MTEITVERTEGMPWGDLKRDDIREGDVFEFELKGDVLESGLWVAGDLIEGERMCSCLTRHYGEMDFMKAPEDTRVMVWAKTTISLSGLQTSRGE